jgi:predicted permease
VLDEFKVSVLPVLRRLWRQPWYAAAAIACLSITIGAAGATFVLLDGLLQRRPPGVAHAEQLWRLSVRLTISADRRFTLPTFSFPQFEGLRDGLADHLRVGAYTSSPVTVGRGATAVQVPGILVTHELVSLLGLAPSIGRVIEAEDDRPDARPVVLVSARLLQLVGADAAGTGIGSVILVNGQPHTIIGLLPARFEGLDHSVVDVCLPLRPSAAKFLGSADALTSRFTMSYVVVGREAVAVSPVTLEARATKVFRSTAAAGPELDPAALVSTARVVDVKVPRLGRAIQVSTWLLALTTLLLLLGATSVAGLIASATLARESELRMRIVLGSSVGRVYGTVLAEATILGGLGVVGGAAVLLATVKIAFTRLAVDLKLAEPAGSPISATFAVMACVVIAFLCVVALAAAPVRGSASMSSALSRFRPRSALQHLVPVIQVALSVVLLIAAARFGATFSELSGKDAGFDIDKLVVVRVPVRSAGFNNHSTNLFFERARTLLEAEPLVERAVVASTAPYGVPSNAAFSIEPAVAMPVALDRQAVVSAVEAGFERTLGLRILRGRAFNQFDTRPAPWAVIVNERMARDYWPSGDPLKACIRLGGPSRPCAAVVGVVSDIVADPRTGSRPEFYIPLTQDDSGSVRLLLVRTRTLGSLGVAEIARVVAGAAPNLPYVEALPLETYRRAILRPWLLAASALACLAAIATIIAILGVHGAVTQHLLTRRTEIGVRLAFGATKLRVILQFLRYHGLVFAVGSGVGVVAAFWGGRLLSSVTGITPELGGRSAIVVVVTFLSVALGSVAWQVVQLLRSTTRRLIDTH